MINLLIKMADSLDQRGLHNEASKVDALIRKIAISLEEDYSNGIRDYSEDNVDDIELEEDISYEQAEEEGLESPEKADLGEDDKISEYELNRGMEVQEAIEGQENDLDDAYDKMILKRKKSKG